jgi:hypothetical protein
MGRLAVSNHWQIPSPQPSWPATGSAPRFCLIKVVPPGASRPGGTRHGGLGRSSCARRRAGVLVCRYWRSVGSSSLFVCRNRECAGSEARSGSRSLARLNRTGPVSGSPPRSRSSCAPLWAELIEKDAFHRTPHVREAEELNTNITKRAFAASILARTPCSQATRRCQSRSRGFASEVAVITPTLPVLSQSCNGVKLAAAAAAALAGATQLPLLPTAH